LYCIVVVLIGGGVYNNDSDDGDDYDGLLTESEFIYRSGTNEKTSFVINMLDCPQCVDFNTLLKTPFMCIMIL
jgi:hypothetical protein